MHRRAQVKHEDVLQLFMEITYKDGRHLTAEEITGMLVALLFAGQVRV